MTPEERESLRLYREWIRNEAPRTYDIEHLLAKLDDPDLDEWGRPIE